MSNIIDKSGDFERLQRQNFVNGLAAGGIKGAELGIWVEIRAAFLESDEEVAKRIATEDEKLRTYIVNNLVEHKGKLEFIVPDQEGLYHWARMLKVVSNEMKTTIKLRRSLILGRGLPPQNYFECEVNPDTNPITVCDAAYNAKLVATKKYLESPLGQRAMIVDDNKPEGERRDLRRVYVRISERLEL